MIIERGKTAGVVLAVLAIGGCASVPEKGGFDDVQGEISARVGQRVEWYQSSDADAQVATALRELLSDGLTEEEAVQIALLNNRALQATYEDLGLAQANLVQAGLLENPVFDLAVFLPEGGGRADLDAGIVQNFLSVLYRPLRKRIAAAQFEAAKLRVTAAVLDLAAETRSAYYRVQANQQIAELLTQVVSATGASYEAAQRLLEAGNVFSLDVARERALYEEARLALAAAEADMIVDRERLNRLMGLWGPEITWDVHNRLAPLPEAPLSLDELERHAIEANLDLAIYRQQIEAVAGLLGIADATALVPELDVGVLSEREEGEWEVGPGIGIEIPVFDQGQARKAAARSDLRRVQQLYWAAGVDIRSASRALRQRLVTARDRAAHVQAVVLPLANQIVNDTQLQYNAMQIGIFQLLQAKRQQIAAGLQYIETLRDYWLVHSEVERLLDGRVAEAAWMSLPGGAGAMSSVRSESSGGH